MQKTTKSALITGASRGIGRAISRALAREGYSLSLCTKTNIDMLKENAKYISDTYGVDTMCMLGDVCDESFISNLSALHIERFGNIDVIVNNAAISYTGLIQDMSYTEWQNLININVSSAFLTTKYLLPSMIKNGAGNIINISSIWGRYGASCEVAYSASKGALDAFTKSLAKEVAPSGISVNAVSCGIIDTKMNAHLTNEEIAAFTDEIPASRIGTPEEVAELVVGIIKAPSYMTGQIIGIDGGY